jgi:hypothetical protein
MKTQKETISSELNHNVMVIDATAREGGVYVLRESKRRRSNQSKRDEIKGICLHNAAVSRVAGQNQKAEVWKLLSQLHDQTSGTQEIFSGWTGQSLGKSVVNRIFRFFEVQGDVQMLATMVCVLRQHQSQKENTDLIALLDQNDAKYDLYIRRYADILYFWGYLALRAEVRKHLSLNDQSNFEARDNNGAVVAITFQCFRCGEDTTFGSNTCPSCREFAFRCAICQVAVRGLIAACVR